MWVINIGQIQAANVARLEQAFGGHVIAGPSGLNEFSLYYTFCSFK